MPQEAKDLITKMI
jgi:serine/threonine protein kinase